MDTVTLPLGVPPEVIAIAWGHHGTQRVLETYRLADLWQFHLFPETLATVRDGQPCQVPASSCMLTPPGVTVAYRFEHPTRHGYAHVRLPTRSEASLVLPAIIPLGERFPLAMATFASAKAIAPIQPLRTQAMLWGMLWDLDGPIEAGHHHPALDRATKLIDNRLHHPFRIRDIATLCGTSHAHLLRLFRETYQQSINAYIRTRRMAMARQLLCHGELPIAHVAQQVGIRDLQHFNKLVRQAWGCSPRVLRGTASTLGK